jgi:Secretion system C-terminal sorting domain
MKKLLVVLILFLKLYPLNGQFQSFEYVFSQGKSDVGQFVTETSDSSFLIVVNDWISATTKQTSIVKLNNKGIFQKKMTLQNDSILCNVKRLIKTNFGYLAVGSQTTNGRAYLWLIKIDNQLNLIDQKLHSVPNSLQELIVDTDRDSNVIIGGSISYNSSIFPQLFGAKINRNGILTYLKYQYPDPSRFVVDPYVGFFDCMITMKDSSRHVFFNGHLINSVDSNFDIVHQMRMPYINNFSYSLNPTALRLTDTTYYIAGKGFENTTNKRTLYLLTLNLNGKYSNFKILGVEDTFEQVATQHCLDTTKNSDTYIGSTFNYPLSCQNPPKCNDTAYFVLQKLDKQRNILWKKRYGKNGQYVMFGLLAANDGGCLMYGYRYTHDTPKKFEAYILKVDGNGIVTSETSIPIAQSNIIPYPNPSNGQLQFKKEDPSVSGTFEVNLFDTSGKLVFLKRETDLSETFDLSHLAVGNYLFHIKKEENIIAIGKWVKIK